MKNLNIILFSVGRSVRNQFGVNPGKAKQSFIFCVPFLLFRAAVVAESLFWFVLMLYIAWFWGLVLCCAVMTHFFFLCCIWPWLEEQIYVLGSWQFLFWFIILDVFLFNSSFSGICSLCKIANSKGLNVILCYALRCF